jgi:hippurate hydrolase
VQTLIERRIGEIARGTATTFGATAEAVYRRGYPPTVNDAVEAEFAASVAAEVCGSACVDRTVPASMGGEDFSFFLQKRPGAMLWLGNGPGEGGCYLHNPKYDFNDTAIPVGTSFLVRCAERFLAREG